MIDRLRRLIEKWQKEAAEDAAMGKFARQSSDMAERMEGIANEVHARAFHRCATELETELSTLGGAGSAPALEWLRQIEWIRVRAEDGSWYETCPACWADRVVRGDHTAWCPLATALRATEGSAPAPADQDRTEHELKVWPPFFDALASGVKTFELRRNDRGFQVGDVLRLREWSPETREYSGRELRRRVTCLVAGAFGLRDDYVCLALAALVTPEGRPRQLLEQIMALPIYVVDTQITDRTWQVSGPWMYADGAPRGDRLVDLDDVLALAAQKPAEGRPAPAPPLLQWAARLVRLVCGATLARDIEADLAEPIRRIALEMRDWKPADPPADPPLGRVCPPVQGQEP